MCPVTPIARLAPGLATQPRQLFSVPLPARSLFTLFTIQNSSDLSPAMQNATPVSPFRMNTCKSVSKQRTLTTFRMNTYEKQGEGGGGANWNLRDTLAFVIICATWRLYLLWSQSIAHTSRHHGGVPILFHFSRVALQLLVQEERAVVQACSTPHLLAIS